MERKREREREREREKRGEYDFKLYTHPVIL